jgi:hypothetical protein
MGYNPLVLAEHGMKQSAAVHLEKLQQHCKGMLDLIVEPLGRHIDEARRQIGDHLLETKAFVGFDTIRVVEDRATFSFSGSLTIHRRYPYVFLG